MARRKSKSDKKSGRAAAGSERTRDVLVAAVVRLLERRSAADLSVREIAAEAGVNHGLVHHYFGSKEGLIREAVIRTSRRMAEEHGPGVNVGWTFDFFRQNPGLAQVAARVCLDGPHDLLPLAAPPREIVEARTALVRRAMARLGVPEIVDPRIVNAWVAAAILGWFALRPLLRAGWDLPADADERIARALALIDAIVGGAAAGAGEDVQDTGAGGTS